MFLGIFQDEGDVGCPGPADRKSRTGARTFIATGNKPLLNFLDERINFELKTASRAPNKGI